MALLATAALLLVTGGVAASPDDDVTALLLRGSYAPAYALLSSGADSGPASAEREYLLAFCAFHALRLDEARTAAKAALAGGYDGPAEGWLSAREIARRSDQALGGFAGRSRILRSDGATAYEVYSNAPEDYTQRVAEVAAAAHRAAAEVAFGSGSGDADTPAISLFEFASDRDAAEFLRTLGLPGRTTGSALSIGLAVLVWAGADGRPSGAGPYAARAALAHETLHCVQALLDAEHAPRWVVEGTALLAEDRMDPNHALKLRCRAIEDVAADPSVLRAALDDEGPDSDYGRYPAYYALASYAGNTGGLRALGELMRDRGSSAADRGSALERHLGLSAEGLVDAVYLHMRSPSWAAARALVRVNDETPAGDTSRRADALVAAHQRWPSEPYIGLLAARELTRAGRLGEAAGIVSALAAEGYLGSSECTVSELAARCEPRRGGLP